MAREVKGEVAHDGFVINVQPFSGAHFLQFVHGGVSAGDVGQVMARVVEGHDLFANNRGKGGVAVGKAR